MDCMAATLDLSGIVQQRNGMLRVIEELRYSRNKTAELQLVVEKMQQERLTLQAELQDTEAKYQDQRSSGEDLQSRLKSLEERIFNQNSDNQEQKLKAALESCQDTIEKLRKQIFVLSSEKTTVEKNLTETNEKLLLKERSSKLLEEQVDKFRETVDKIRKDLSETAAVQERLEKNVLEAETINKNTLKSLKHKQCIIGDLQHERDHLKQQIASLTIAKTLGVAADDTTEKKELGQMQQKLRSLAAEHTVLSGFMDSLKAELQEYKAKLSEANAATSKSSELLVKNEIQSKAEIEELQEKLHKCLLEIEALRGAKVSVGNPDKRPDGDNLTAQDMTTLCTSADGTSRSGSDQQCDEKTPV